MSERGSYETAPDAITSRLARGEKLIWWDRPRPRLLAKREINVGFFFGFFIFGFSLFWMWGASEAGAFALFGLLPMSFGLWLISAPFRAFFRAPNLAFGLSDRRAVIVARNEIKSFPLEQIEFVDTKSFNDGGGHVFFYNEPVIFGTSPFYQPGAMQKNGFLAIAKAEQVSATLLDMIETRRRARPDLVGSARG